VEEAVLLIPHTYIVTYMDHRRGNPQEMFDELEGHVYIGRIFHGQLCSVLEHVQAEESHPCRAVRLLQMAAGRQWRAAVEDAYVVQAQKTSLKDVLVGTVFAIVPPGKVEDQFLEEPFEPQEV